MNRSLLRHRGLITGAKLAVLVLLAWAVHATLLRALHDLNRPEFSRHLWEMQARWLLAAGLLYAGGMLPSAYFSYRLLRALEQPVGLGEVLRAYYVSQIGKYVPGKALVIVLRAGLLDRPEVERTVVAASIFVDTLTSMACGALMAAATLAIAAPQQRLAIVSALGMLAVTGVPAMPRVLARLASWLGVTRINPRATERLRGVPWQTLALGWLCSAVSWLMYGLSLWAVLRAIGASDAGPLAEWPLHTASVALAVVAGFLTFIPAGFVGREFVLTELMAPQYGAALAALSALLLRLVWLVAEVTVSSILYFAGRGRARRQ